MALVCQLCPAERALSLPFTLKDYLKHIELFHAHQPNFHIMCGIGGCQRTFHNLQTFRNHISDHHSYDCNPTNQPVATYTSSEVHDSIEPTESHDCNWHTAHEDSVGLSTTLSTIQTSSALFILGLKEERKLTQTALQGVIEGVTTLSRSRLSALHAEVCSTLNAAGVSPSSISGLNELFDSDGPFGRPFSGLETQHQQLSFYKTHFQFIVRYSFIQFHAHMFSLWVFFLSGTGECTSW